MADGVLVSGGSGGIGAATCALLAERGFVPIVGYAGNARAAERIAAETGGIALPLDLTDQAGIEAAVARLAQDERGLAGVVLAASPPPDMAPFGQTDDAAMERQWRVNVTGPRLLLARLVKAKLRKRKAGACVGVLTAAMGAGGDGASPGMAAYVIAKYGLQGVLAAAAAEYPWLRVSSVSPGYTETAMLEAFDPRFLELARARAPFARAEDVARDIVDRIVAS